MLVELTVNWAYASTPVVPFPARVYWRLKGATSYSNVNVADGTTTTITTINDGSTTLNTACTLEYEGYVIPLCFVDDPTNCDPYLSDGVTVNPACPTTNRSYWDATVDATDEQACRGVTVSCESSGVYAIHAVNQTQFFAQQWAAPGPVVLVSGGAPGTGFSAIPAPGAYNSTTGFMVKDCWIVTQGNGYTTTPTVILSRSNAGVDVAMEVTMACNDFTYQDCKSGTQTYGQILLGESQVVCMPLGDYNTFEPEAVNSVFDISLGGCCTGNGQRYTLTFTSPDPALYPSVVYVYTAATTSGSGQLEATLYHGVPIIITNCAVIGSLTAYTPPSGVACISDTETNIWLFNNHVVKSNITSC